MNVATEKDSLTRLPILSEYNDMLCVEDLSVIFGVSKQTVYKEIKSGKFGIPKRIGRAFKIPKSFIIENFFVNYS